jgi:plasmid stabilization system protein ParE
LRSAAGPRRASEAAFSSHSASQQRPARDIAEDNPDAAQRLRVEFHESLRTLAHFPGIGHYREELLGRKYRFWNFYSYVIVYVWEARPIQVISVVHGARDLAVFLAGR